MSDFSIPTGKWTPPPKIDDLFADTAGNKWSNINRPTAGARSQEDLPVGDASFQLYSLSTPNGQKIGIMLEELGIDYDAHVINFSTLDQFKSGFVNINLNSKIPAAVDKDGPGGKSISLFESASILLYLGEKYGRFIPTDPFTRAEMMNWVFWQMAGLGPMAGNFGHFFVYAPDDKIEARNYGVARYGMETQRLLSVLDNHLKGKTFIVGEEYTIADIASYPWVHQLYNGYPHSSGIKAAEFLSMDQYENVKLWCDRIAVRPAVQRGVTVCSSSGKPWLNDSKL
eukprot:CAMPEP_0182428404 /NCGR_PEP_ID=MMETSP1167-20130531/22908_1 /TAXON_ID=2988 /ORGANISM="Mallomonas Sp, Strain CCMP3275" /LENGTH=283 /DNA_ID=CAMNT_0024611305 /DNA_START=60 /DNA_END=911 /DNA_ORIENTATION=+